MNVSPEAFDVLVRLAKAAGADAHDWAAVIYEESTWNPAIRNGSGAPYFGLNQMGEREARSVGFTGDFPEGWLALSSAEQLPYVARFFVQKRNAVGPVVFASAAHLLAANFLPAFMHGNAGPNDIDYPLVSRGDADGFYQANAGYDIDHKGSITIRDLGRTIERIQSENPHDTAALRAGVDAAVARAPSSPDSPGQVTIPVVVIHGGDPDPVPPSGSVVALLLVGAAVVGAWMIANRS